MNTSSDISTFNIVVAVAKDNAIGKGGNLPWPRLKKEMAHFVDITTHVPESSSSSSIREFPVHSSLTFTSVDKKDTKLQNAVIMGRKTWESIIPKYRPLKNRLNIVLSENKEYKLEGENKQSDALLLSSLEEALTYLSQPHVASTIHEVYVIGGSRLYKEALTTFEHKCKSIFYTRINKTFSECDTFMTTANAEKFERIFISKTFAEEEVPYDFTVLINKQLFQENPNQFDWKLILEKYPKHEELQYFDIIKEVLSKGLKKQDRTGVGVYSLFGKQMRFDLSETFPLLTTKTVFWRGVVEELIWFIKGETNAKKLSDKKVKIWDDNGSRKFLDNLGLTHREEGDLGPVYGFQWRHFGAKYEDMYTNYTNQGIDQLKDLIKKIKEDPNDRRLIMCAWNPTDIPIMALPPCHVLAQFYVSDKKLSCQMYQRSCDLGLGVPFNIASYALLTCMIADICGLERGEFVHVLGDAHVYNNHVDALKEQLERHPNPFPILKIKNKKQDIEDFVFEDFELVCYTAQSRVQMKMAV